MAVESLSGNTGTNNPNPTRGNIARQMMKDSGLPIDNDKLIAAHKEKVEGGGEVGTAAANNGNNIEEHVVTPAPGENIVNEEKSANEQGEGGKAPASVEPKTKTPTTKAPIAEPTAVDEAELLRLLNEKTGRKFKSLEELNAPPAQPTEEQLQEQQEREESEAIAYALKNDLIDRKTLEQYAVDKAKPPRDIAYQIFAGKMKEFDPKMTDAQIADRFAEYTQEYQEDGSPLKALGEQMMQSMADAYMKENYDKVLNIKDPYTKFKTDTEQAKAYRGVIREAAAEVPRELKFSVPVIGEDGSSTNHEYGFTVSDDVIKAIQDDFLKPETFSALRQRNLDKDGMKDAIEIAVQRKLMSDVISVVAKSHADKILANDRAHRRNIPTLAGQGTAFKTPSGNRNSIARQAMTTN